MKPFFPALLLAAVVLAGCGTTPHSRLYTLTAEANQTHRVTAAPYRIEVVSVRIPEVWDRAQLVTTKSPREVNLSEFHRWAAPLKSDVPRVVVQNLVRILDNPTIWLRADFVGTRPDLRVQVSIDQIEAVPGQGLRLDATWTILSPARQEGVKIGRASFSEAMSDASYDAIVASMSQALLSLSLAIAKDVGSLPQK